LPAGPLHLASPPLWICQSGHYEPRDFAIWAWLRVAPLSDFQLRASRVSHFPRQPLFIVPLPDLSYQSVSL
jgi:hypothetical protein